MGIYDHSDSPFSTGADRLLSTDYHILLRGLPRRTAGRCLPFAAVSRPPFRQYLPPENLIEYLEHLANHAAGHGIRRPAKRVV